MATRCPPCRQAAETLGGLSSQTSAYQDPAIDRVAARILKNLPPREVPPATTPNSETGPGTWSKSRWGLILALGTAIGMAVSQTVAQVALNPGRPILRLRRRLTG